MRLDTNPESAASRIPFNKPYLTGHELRYLSEAVESRQIAGDGPFTLRCARRLEQEFGIPRVLITPSGTSALEMAAMLCDLGPGDEVIVPSFTFTSTANAFVRLGARPVFVEVRPDTLNIDETRIAEAITPRTKAIFPIHYAGVACEMDEILRIAKSHGLKVVEDAAQGVNAYYQGRALGSLGDFGVYSFHDTKNLICGEGGALCLNDPAAIERAEILRDKGTNRAKFFRGEVDKYTWIEGGTSAIPSELACAFLFAQIEQMDAIRVLRRRIYRRYEGLLKPLADRGFLRLPCIPDGCQSHFRGFHIVLSSGRARDSAMAYLKQHGVSAVFHFVPLHTSPMGARFGYHEGDLPITEEMAGRLLRLPCFISITPSEQERVVSLLSGFLERMRVEGGSDYCLPCVGLDVATGSRS